MDLKEEAKMGQHKPRPLSKDKSHGKPKKKKVVKKAD